MPNRLAAETSPYLQQHADNPVDWHPWSAESLALAQRENRPILLSIGYSACHWCHVMAHESFEDAAVAAVMNRLFVNIKVDREERPDLDQIYQKAHQMLNRRPGGWPLTLFLTPDGTPFYGGTYFPKTPRYALPGFVDLLEHVGRVFRERRADIEEQNRHVRAALASRPAGAAVRSRDFSRQPIRQAIAQYAEHFDARYGGFGSAPKFPQPSSLELLQRDGSPTALHMLDTTLRRMAEGGLQDHLGGGFARYSVDERWLIPHFEKMLYDNGALLKLYAQAHARTGEALFRRAAQGIATWVMHDMQAPAGGYYASRDADSEGEEGRYYVWSRDEVRALLDDEEFTVAALHWGLNAAPGFEGKAWQLHVAATLDEIARQLALPAEKCAQLLQSARDKLMRRRCQRVPPARDEKILVSWNALMIEGMARAGRLLQQTEWLASARRSLDFIRRRLWQNGRLLATCRDEHAHLNAYLDDYAFLLAAQLELLQSGFRSDDLAFATALADRLLDAFEDCTDGGFFFTSHDHERLIERPKPVYDNATPAGNGVAAQALQRLALITGETRYAVAAERALAVHYPAMAAEGSGTAALLLALDDWLAPPRLIVVRGAEADLPAWQNQPFLHALDKDVLLFLPQGLAGLPQGLDKPFSGNEATPVNAWVCAGVACLPPVSSLQSLRELLEAVGNVK